MREKPTWRNLVPILLVILITHLFLLSMTINLSSKSSESDLVQKVLHIKWRKVMKQIVHSEESDNVTPKDEAFLSDKDRSFDRQSVSFRVRHFQAQASLELSKNMLLEKLSLSDLGLNHQVEKNIQKVSSNNDYVKDIPLGELTHLNTAEYKYFSYFQRIRQRLENYWGASIEDKVRQLAQQGRRLLSDENMTSLRVCLDHLGRVLWVKVLGSSGIRELDEAAIESFNEAGPFTNPPKDLVQDGRVTFEWGFVVRTQN
jgi:TonB family protein